MKKNLVIIFDFDGTISEIIKSPEKIVNILAGEFGFKKVKAGEVEILKEKKAEEVIKTLNISLIKLPFILMKGRFLLGKEMEKLKPIEGMKEALRCLLKDRYELWILTSNSKENVINFLKKNQMEFFDFIFSEKRIFGKGNALVKLIKKRKLKPENVFFVGDETRDIEAAKKAKVKTIAVTWGINKEELLKKHNPDHLVRTPEDLIKILKRI